MNCTSIYSGRVTQPMTTGDKELWNKEYIENIRQRLEEDSAAREQREMRRRRALMEQLQAHEAQQVSTGLAYLSLRKPPVLYLIHKLRPLIYKYDQNFAEKPVICNLQHASVVWLIVITFLASRRPFTIITPLQIIVHVFWKNCRFL